MNECMYKDKVTEIPSIGITPACYWCIHIYDIDNSIKPINILRLSARHRFSKH